MCGLYMREVASILYSQYKPLKIILGLEQFSLFWINEKCQNTNVGGSSIIGNRKKYHRRVCSEGIVRINVHKFRRESEVRGLPTQ